MRESNRWEGGEKERERKGEIERKSGEEKEFNVNVRWCYLLLTTSGFEI